MADECSRALVADALHALDVRNLTLGIHDQCFPSLPTEDIGRGTPYSEGARAFIAFVRDLGFNGLQLGPQGQTSESNPSPYDGTIFSKNVLNVALGSLVQGFLGGEPLLSRATLESLVAALPSAERDRVQYRYAFAAQRRALAEAYETFARLRDAGRDGGLGARLREFEARARPWLERDALYAALTDEHGSDDWRAWPGIDARLYDPLPGEEAACEVRVKDLRARHAACVEAYVFGQWLVHEQHRALRDALAPMEIKLFGDLQIGYAHQDIWSYHALFLREYVMGAPPSRTNPEGQPWNYPVLDPAKYFELGAGTSAGPALRMVRARMNKMLEEFDGVRIDHPHGLVCPWVYRSDWPDALRALQSGARLFSSPDLPDHPALARYAIARPDQIDRSVPRYADGWVRTLSDEQVARYAVLMDAVVDAAHEHGRLRSDLACEVLSTMPYPLGRVLQRHGLGRFRVTQKADPHDPHDVYRSESAQPEDWIMVGNHDTKPVWLVVEEWMVSGAASARAAQLAARLLPEEGDRAAFARALEAEPGELAHALYADVFASRARNVLVFFTDLLGSREIYNTPGIVSERNWSLRVPPDYRAVYAARLARGRALSLPRALAWALRARGGEFARAHRELAAALLALAARER